MNPSQSITFLSTSWSLSISVLIVIVGAALCYLAWRRSGYRRSTGLLELMRLTLIILAAVLFNQPEFTQEFRPTEKPAVAVLWDDSPSMETRDVQASKLMTRREATAKLVEPTSWDGLADHLKVEIESFSGGPQSSGSDLHSPLAAAVQTHHNLVGVVLVSDGDWNEGAPPVEAAARLRLKDVPVFAVPVGSPRRLPDVELLDLNAPTFGIAGKSVRIPFTLESSLPRDYETSVTLTTSSGETLSKQIRVPAMGRTNDWILWKPNETGDYTLTLEIPTHQEETLDDNNQLTAPIAIREEELRVLIVESYPRWEYRYLRNALSRDPGVVLSCLLFHPGLSKAGGGSQDYIKQFPGELDELAPFDVVFLGDVGLDENQLTAEDCERLKGLVEHQASGLVLMPGWQGRQFSLLQTELAELFPVLLDEIQPGGWGLRTPSHFELTESGRRSLLTKLADTEEENSEVWGGLPGFQWYAPVLRAKAGSEVLCVHKDVTNEYGRLPLLVTRTYGAGKVLFMGTDGAWRWRKGVEDKYHYRFWGQVVRWMAYQRNMAEGKTMRLFYSPDQPQIEQTVTLNANVMASTGEPLSQGEVTARIVAPSGEAETVRFTSTGDDWGAFTGRFTAHEPGKHAITLACKQTQTSLEASFFVQGTNTERTGLPARPEVLEEIARVTQGRVLAPDQVNEIVDSLASLPLPPLAVRRIQLWNHPLVASLLVVLIGLFWVGRKGVGLI